MVASPNQSPQSDRADVLEVVVDDAGSACWQICSRGVCLRDRNGARLMARFRDLLISQGRLVPLS